MSAADLPELERRVAQQDRQIAELRDRLQIEVERRDRVVRIMRGRSDAGLDRQLEFIMTSATELLHAQTSSLLVVDEETNELTFELATGQPGEVVTKYYVPPGQGIAGWVAEHAQPAISNYPDADPRFYSQIDRAGGFETHSILAVPLTIRDRVIGVMEIINKLDEAGFTDTDQGLALALANQAALLIDNVRLYARLTDTIVPSRVAYRL